MGAGHQETRPHDGAGHDIGERRAQADPLKAKNHENAKRCDHEADGLKAAGIEEGDDQHSNHIVNDRQGEQEDPHTNRDRPPQQRKYAHGKGDVRGGRHGPATAAYGIGVQGQIDHGGDDDAANCCDHGQHRLLARAQGALMNFAPDLHSDDEEEDRHQRVVDPEVQRPGVADFAEPN
jgi:hypothetical protein